MIRKPQLQVLDLALGATPVQTAVLDGGDARRIIAAIFEPAQRIDESASHRIRSEYADDAAHGSSTGASSDNGKMPPRSPASPVPVRTPIGQIPQVTAGVGSDDGAVGTLIRQWP